MLRLRLPAALLLAAWSRPSMAQTGATADQVKAAYLHKFAGYVEWPAGVFAETAGPFVIGVYGADGVYAALTRLAAGRPVQGRSVEVRQLQAHETAAEVHIVFIGNDWASQLPALLKAYDARPVVTVTETSRGLLVGAVLNFVEVERRIRFEAAPQAAAQRGLKLSSRLLVVAERVAEGAP